MRREPSAVEEAATRHVVDQILSLLNKKEITKTELADRLGVSVARVSQMLSSDSNMTVRTLFRIARVCDVQLAIGFPKRR